MLALLVAISLTSAVGAGARGYLECSDDADRAEYRAKLADYSADFQPIIDEYLRDNSCSLVAGNDELIPSPVKRGYVHGILSENVVIFLSPNVP